MPTPPNKNEILVPSIVDFGNGNHSITVTPRDQENTAALSGLGYLFGKGSDNITVTLNSGGQTALNNAYLDFGAGTNALTVAGNGKAGQTALKGGTAPGEGALVTGTTGVDKITLSGVEAGLDNAHLDLGAGNNIVDITASSAAMTNGSSLLAGAGADKITVSGTISASSIDAGAGNNTLVLGKVTNASTVSLGDGKNSVTIAELSGGASLTSGAGGDSVRLGALDSGSQVRLGAGNDTLYLGDRPGSGVTLDGGDGTGDVLNVGSRPMVTLDQIRGDGTITNFEFIDLTNKAAGALYVRAADLNGYSAPGLVVSGRVTVDKAVSAGITPAQLQAALQGQDDGVLRVNGDSGAAGDKVYFENGWTKVGTAMGYDVWSSDARALNSSKLIMVKTGIPVEQSADLHVTVHAPMSMQDAGLSLKGINYMKAEPPGAGDFQLKGLTPESDGSYKLYLPDGVTHYGTLIPDEASGTFTLNLMPGVHTQSSYAAMKAAAQADLAAAEKAVATAQTALVSAEKSAAAAATAYTKALAAATGKISQAEAKLQEARDALAEEPTNAALQKAVTRAEAALAAAKAPVEKALAARDAADAREDAAETALRDAKDRRDDLGDTLESITAKTGLTVSDNDNLTLDYLVDGKERTLTIDLSATNYSAAKNNTDALPGSPGGSRYAAAGDAAYKITGTFGDDSLQIDGDVDKGGRISLGTGNNELIVTGTVGEGTAKAAVGVTVTAAGINKIALGGMANASLTTNGGDDTLRLERTAHTEPKFTGDYYQNQDIARAALAEINALDTGTCVAWSSIDMGEGANTLVVSNLKTTKDAYRTLVLAEAGKDMAMSNSTVKGGNGGNNFSFTGTNGITASTITTGTGNDSISITSHGRERTPADGSSPVDNTEPNPIMPRGHYTRGLNYAVGAGSVINAGNGDNTITVTAAMGTGLGTKGRILTGSGNDKVEILTQRASVNSTDGTSTAVSGAEINVGDGNNTVTIQGKYGLLSETNAAGKVTAAAVLRTGRGDDVISLNAGGDPSIYAHAAKNGGMCMSNATLTDTGGNNALIMTGMAPGAICMNNSTVTLGAGNDTVNITAKYRHAPYGEYPSYALYGGSVLNTGAGNDQVGMVGGVQGLNTKKQAVINLGAGDNTLNMESNIKYASILGGAQNDLITIAKDPNYGTGQYTFGNKDHSEVSYTTVDLGSGNNTLTAGAEFDFTTIKGGKNNDVISIIGELRDSSITDAGGDNSIGIRLDAAGAILLSNSKISLGAGKDTVRLEATAGNGVALDGKSALNTGAGDDVVQITGNVTAMHKTATGVINLGAGNNTLSIDGNVGFQTYIVDQEQGTWATPENSTYVSILGGAQSDVISIRGTVTGATVNAGAGNDSVSLDRALGEKAVIMGGAGVDTLNVSGLSVDAGPGERRLNFTSATLAPGKGSSVSGFEAMDVHNNAHSTMLFIDGPLPLTLGGETSIRYTLTYTGASGKATGATKTYNEKALIITGADNDKFMLSSEWSLVGTTVYKNTRYFVVELQGGKSRLLIDAKLEFMDGGHFTDPSQIPAGSDLAYAEVTLGDGGGVFTLNSILQSTLSLGNGGTTINVAQAIRASGLTAGSGADSLSAAEINRSTLDFGAGDNTLSVSGGLLRSLLAAGSGNDRVTAGSAGDTTINLGDGNNTLNIAGKATQTGVATGGGNDVITLGEVEDATITLGAGAAAITMEGGVNGLNIDGTAGGGKASLTFSGSSSLTTTSDAWRTYPNSTGATRHPAGDPDWQNRVDSTYNFRDQQGRPCTNYYGRYDDFVEHVTTNTGDIRDGVVAKFGSGDDTLTIGSESSALCFTDSFFDLGDGNNKVELHLKKNAGTVKESRVNPWSYTVIKDPDTGEEISRTPIGFNNQVPRIDTPSTLTSVMLAGNLGDAKIRIDDENLKHACFSLQIGGGKGKTILGNAGFTSEQDYTAIDFGQGYNTLRITDITELHHTHFTFGANSRNTVSSGSEKLGVLLNDVIFDMNLSESSLSLYGDKEKNNTVAVRNASGASVQLGGGNDKVSLIVNSEADYNRDIDNGNMSTWPLYFMDVGGGENTINVKLHATEAQQLLLRGNINGANTDIDFGEGRTVFKINSAQGADARIKNADFIMGNGGNILEVDAYLENASFALGTGANEIYYINGRDGFGDTVSLSSQGSIFCRSVSLHGGNNSFSFNVSDGTAEKPVYSYTTVSMGDGDDTLNVTGALGNAAYYGYNMDVPNAFSVGGGNNAVSITGSDLNGDCLTVSGNLNGTSLINTRGGNDRVALRDALLADGAKVELGAGDDMLVMRGNKIHGSGLLDGGVGHDILNLDNMGPEITFGSIFGDGKMGISGFEHLDLRGNIYNGAGGIANTLNLSMADVLNMGAGPLDAALAFDGGSIAQGAGLVRISGDAGLDSAKLKSGEWTASLGTYTTTIDRQGTAETITYNVYQGTGDHSDQYLLVQQNLLTTFGG